MAVRLAVDELQGPTGITSDGEGREVIECLAELPDLWDVNVAGHLRNDSRSSRFSDEGFQEPYVAFVKSLTSKPVVSVGRFTSPDTMVSQIKRGIQDFIGAARPSIADPFLPKKIAEGREMKFASASDAIFVARQTTRVCRYAARKIQRWGRMAPRLASGADRASRLRCIDPRRRRRAIGPGSEPGPWTPRLPGDLGGNDTRAGGRVVREASLPGLGKWIRVRDYRLQMLSKLGNVEIFRESPLSAEDIREFGARHVVLATGSQWRRDGIGSFVESAPKIAGPGNILTPDDIFAGRPVEGPVLVYDDEHYAMGGALAERLLNAGHEVTLVTPAAMISAWTVMTDEQYLVQKRLLELGAKTYFNLSLIGIADHLVALACVYTGREQQIEFGTLVMVTGRLPRQEVYEELIFK